MWSMPTVARHAPRPGTRKPLYLSATLALAVEALLLAGVGAWLIQPRISAPRRSEPMTITLTPPTAQAPKRARRRRSRSHHRLRRTPPPHRTPRRPNPLPHQRSFPSGACRREF
jgi:hypothetical protein